MIKAILKPVLLVSAFLATLATGFALGVYMLPIIIAPESPADAEIQKIISTASYKADFQRDIPGSDFLHWGEGQLGMTTSQVAFKGELAPGPDYRLYLVPEYVSNDVEFLAVKSSAVQLGEVNTFENFIVDYPANSVNLENYNTLLVWCETFKKFISASQYR